jgi:hypothetical protein
MIKVQGKEPGSESFALALMGQLQPTRIEWSYVTDRAMIGRFKETTPVFVAALNTITPPGHAVSFEGTPIIAPWMTSFGKPGARMPYICQNNPEDLAARIGQAVALMTDGVTDTFQFDDWYGNAQMLWYPNACFCEHCQKEFAAEMGLPIHYRDYLRGRGFTHTAELFEAAKQGKVPLWEDYVRFQQQTVTRFFRRLRQGLDQALGQPVTLSVNGSVLDFGGRIETVLPFVDYFNGETHDFAPEALVKMAEASRRRERKQVVSFFPPTALESYDDAAFVRSVNRGIALCYCLGLQPLFPYDVYAGNDPKTGKLKPRWYGTWEQYQRPYETVREHPEWFDHYDYESAEVREGETLVRSVRRDDKSQRLTHRVMTDGTWTTGAG